MRLFKRPRVDVPTRGWLTIDGIRYPLTIGMCETNQHGFRVWHVYAPAGLCLTRFEITLDCVPAYSEIALATEQTNGAVMTRGAST